MVGVPRVWMRSVSRKLGSLRLGGGRHDAAAGATALLLLASDAAGLAMVPENQAETDDNAHKTQCPFHACYSISEDSWWHCHQGVYRCCE